MNRHLLKFCMSMSLLLSPFQFISGANFLWVGGINFDITFGGNWIPAGPPLNGDVGQFSNAAIALNPSLNGNVVYQIGTISFLDNTGFIITAGNNAIFQIQGAGVQNFGTTEQVFAISGSASLLFQNAAMADNGSGLVHYDVVDSNSSIAFFNNASANAATFSNNGGAILFLDNSTAGFAVIEQTGPGASVSFTNTTGADFATITANNQSSIDFRGSATADTSNLFANSGSTISFSDTTVGFGCNITLNDSTLLLNDSFNASSAIISGTSSTINFADTSQAAASQISVTDSVITYSDGSTAQGSNTILNNSELNFSDNSNASLSTTSALSGSAISFSNTSTAQNSTVNTDASTILFSDTSTANDASFTMANDSQLTFVDSTTADSAIIQATDSEIFFTENSLSAAASITLNANAELNFQQPIADVFSGTLSGVGITNKSGTGLLNFLANGAAYTGQTQITNGIFVLNSNLGGDLFVSGQGFLSGIGTALGNVTINSGGTISPGNSIGTINILGNFTQNPGSTYLVELNGAGQSDLINVSGTAILNGGVVNAISDDGTFALFTPYTILHSDDGVSGAYTPGVFLTTPAFRVNLLYDPLNVYLLLGTNFGLFAETSNQRNVAAQFDNLFDPTGDELVVIDNLFSLPIPKLRNALDQMGGEQYTALVATTHKGTQRFLRRMYDPLRSIIANPCCYDACSNNFDIWGAVSGGRIRLDHDRNAHGYHVNNYNLTLGAQKRINQELAIGIAGAYEEDCIHYHLGGSGKLHYGLGGFYGIYANDSLYVLSDLVFGYNDCKVSRRIDFASIDRRAHSKPKIFQTTFYAEAGKNLRICNFALQPFIGIETGYYNRHKSHESGADSLNLNIRKRSVCITTSRLGVHAQTLIGCGFALAADVAWQHNFNFRRDHITARFQDFGNNFRITGVNFYKDSIDLSLFAAKAITECLDVYAEVSGQVWRRYSNYSITGGLLYNW